MLLQGVRTYSRYAIIQTNGDPAHWLKYASLDLRESEWLSSQHMFQSTIHFVMQYQNVSTAIVSNNNLQQKHHSPLFR